MEAVTWEKFLIVAGIAFWIAETWYFGWNETPSCEAEKIADHIAAAMFVIGYVFK